MAITRPRWSLSVSLYILWSFLNHFLENNTILLKFEAHKNFRNKNLSVEITNVDGLHDIYGNKMQRNKVNFKIGTYIVYPERSRNRMMSLGAFCKSQLKILQILTFLVSIGFLLIAFIGICTSCISTYYGLRSIVHPIIDLFERLQYFTFLLFINTELPPHQIDFISSIFKNTMELGYVWKQALIDSFLEDYAFSSMYQIAVRIFS